MNRPEPYSGIEQRVVAPGGDHFGTLGDGLPELLGAGSIPDR